LRLFASVSLFSARLEGSVAKRFDREKYLSIGFHGIKPTAPQARDTLDRAPVVEHKAYSLPRWYPGHKGKYTKNGVPIVSTKAERDHIKKASGGKYVYD
jgi:hypothetical protein